MISLLQVVLAQVVQLQTYYYYYYFTVSTAEGLLQNCNSLKTILAFYVLAVLDLVLHGSNRFQRLCSSLNWSPFNWSSAIDVQSRDFIALLIFHLSGTRYMYHLYCCHSLNFYAISLSFSSSLSCPPFFTIH